MAKDELSKIDPEAVNPSTVKNLKESRAELDKGQKEIVACQKRIRIADHSEFSWTTVK